MNRKLLYIIATLEYV